MTAVKPLRVKEAFYTLQGEGARSGRASVFIRFSKCNLWNGKESGRASALCQFCDTDITGIDGTNGGEYSAGALLDLPSLCGATYHKANLMWCSQVANQHCN